MATKEQVGFFRALYVEEEQRYAQIEARARLYLGIVTVFLASIVLKATDVRTSMQTLGLPWAAVIAEAALLGVSLVLIVLGSLIRTYEGLADPQQIVDEYPEELPPDKEFFRDVIASYVVATTRNSKVNDNAAGFIQFAGIALAAAMILLLCFLVAAIKIS